jgi:microcystin-dependent protein
MAYVAIPTRVDGVDANSAADINQLNDNCESLKNQMPTGSVIPFAGATAPTGFLICDATAVSRTTYADLFTVIGTTYGVGDNSTTFNLPDMRETIPVGVGTRGAGVTAHDTYTLGQFKDDQFQMFQVGAAADSSGARDYYSLLNTRDNVDQGVGAANYATTTSLTTGQGNAARLKPVSDGTNGTPRTGTTTHGKQIGMNYIIKY